MDDKISVIVPVYNVEQYLPQCIESLTSQKYKNLEIILVNDGSTDESGKVCDSFSKKDSRIKVIHKKNQGVSIARNTGIKSATGKYIAFVDGDDFVHEDIYVTLHSQMSSSNYDLVMCRFYRYFSEDRIEIESEPLIENRYKKNEVFKDLMLPMIGNDFNNTGKPLIMGAIWRCLYKKSIIEQNNITIPKIKIAEDMLFHLEYLGYCDNVQVIDKPLYYYRYNDVSATKKYITSLWETLSYQLELVEEYLQKFNLLNDESKERLESNKIYFVSWCFTNECHPNNSKNYRQAIKEMKRIRKTNHFKAGFKMKNIMTAPLKERCIFMCMKFKLYGMIYVYNKRKFASIA